MDKLHLLAKPGESLASVTARAERLRTCVRECEPCPYCQDGPLPGGWIEGDRYRCADCEDAALTTELHEQGYWHEQTAIGYERPAEAVLPVTPAPDPAE